MWAAETRGGRRPWEIEDGLWARIEPLLTVAQRRFDHPGRKRLDDRRVLCGILFVLYTGIAWRFLPRELGFGSGITCWRRLRDWNDAGVWQRLHEVLLAELRGAGMLDLSASLCLVAHTHRAETHLWLHAADGKCWPVIETTRGVVRVRFRDDDMAQPVRAGVRGHVLLARLRALAARPVVLGLGEGEGYLVHNHRVLHGRTSFLGYRRVVRLLANVRPEHRFAWLNDGFALGGR